MNRRIYLGGWLIIGLAILIVLYLGYMMIFPLRVFQYNSTHTIVLNENHVVSSGENLILSVNRCKYVDSTITLSRVLVNDIVYMLPESKSTLKKGCGAYNISIHMPSDIPAGQYYLHSTATVNVNPFRTLQYSIDSEAFNVTKK